MKPRSPTELKTAVYGPVASWRLGRSLGIDLLCRPKTCSFDCIYCQLGATCDHTALRKEFVSTARVLLELEALPKPEVDFVTFSGMGEPTLASNLGDAIEAVKSRVRLPVAVLTNSSLMADGQVRTELARADIVVAKLDAADEGSLREVNRPLSGIRFAAVLEGLARFRDEYPGRLAIQVMFCHANRGRAGEIATLIRDLRPDDVQLNTPLRPSPVPPLSPREMAEMGRLFVGLPVVSVYEASKPSVAALDAAETAARRPAGEHSGGAI